MAEQTIRRPISSASPGQRENAVWPALLLALYPFVLMSALETWENPGWPLVSRLLAAAFFNAGFFASILLSLPALPFRSIRSSLNAFFWIYLSAFTFASIYHFHLYRQALGITSIYSMIDTNADESVEFLYSFFKPDGALLGAVAAIPLVWALIRFQRTLGPDAVVRPVKGLVCLSACLLLGMVGLEKPFLYNNNPFLFVIQSLQEVGDQKREMADAKEKLSRRALNFALDRGEAMKDDGPSLHVLVIGEATTSRHMSLYGYRRATTPRLDAMRNTLNVATDACSSRGITILALQELLTFATRDDRAALFSMPNLVEIMKHAGYKTFWLSNQQPIGYGDTWASIFAKSADKSLFVNKRGWTSGVSLDEKLLAPFDEALADPAPKKFIVLHLIGSHAAYALRYPSVFENYGATATDGIHEQVKAQGSSLASRFMVTSPLSQYNAYDNSILYNDHIVSTFIEKVRSSERSTLTYTSDHGEAVFEVRGISGHVDGVAPRQVYEVPLLFSLSPKVAKNLGPEREGAFGDNLRRPYQTDRLIHTLLDLYGVPHAGFDPSHSLLSPRFKEGPRFCDTLKDQ